MTLKEAGELRTGDELLHARYGRAVVRGPVNEDMQTIWIDTPDNALCPDLPYNAHISQLAR